MEPLLPIPVTLVVVVAFAVVASTLVHRYLHGRAALSGVEYVFIGALMGDFGVGLLSTQVIDQLKPFLFLALGLAGFALGLRVRSRIEQASGFFGGVLSALLIAGIVGAAVFGLLSTPWAPLALYHDRWWLAWTLGATAAATSGMAVQMAIARAAAHGAATETLRGFSLAGSVVAVFIAGAALAESQALSESNQLGMTPAEWLGAVLLLSLLLGALFQIFMGPRVEETEHEDRLFLALVGVITFTSGIASAVGVSPLLTCAVAGVTVSLISRTAASLAHSMERLEGPALAVVTIFAGAMWIPPESWFIWLLPLGYLIVRSLALTVGTRAGLATQPSLPPSIGLGGAMSTQGGLAAAIALDFALVYPEDGSVILGTVLLALVVFDFVGTGRLARFLSDAGEAGRQRFQADGSPIDGDGGDAPDRTAPEDAVQPGEMGDAREPVGEHH